MPYDLALFDLIDPYVLQGDSYGRWHAALSTIRVSEHTMTVDDAGVVIRGLAVFSGDVQPWIDPTTMTFGVNAENTEGHPATDPGRRDPWIDVRDAHIDFELTAPRVASQKVSAAVAAIGSDPGFAPSAAIISAFDSNAAHPAPSDYPSTEFTLDMLLTTVVLRPPFLRGAKLDPSGQLLTDPTHATVTFTLPKIKVRLAQGSGATDPLSATLLSLGASGLDATEDLGVADLVTMDPPYAFIGTSNCVGFGFRTATLDLSSGSTPPDILSQFGFDESWTGLYLPEIRLFIAPHGAQDLAVDAGARNLLIGFGASAGITGDFDLEIIDQGSGQVHVSARFYDAAGRCYGITRSSDTVATVALPDHTRMVVDIDGGLTPYTAGATFDGGASQPGRLFDFDLSANPTRTIVITATGSQPGATPVTLTITANRLPASLPAPAGSTSPIENPSVDLQTTSITQDGSTVLAPRLRLVSETASSAVLALDTDPTTAAQTHWTIDGTDGGISATASVNVAQGATVQVQAVLPGATGVGTFTAFYRFDHPQPGSDSDTAAYATNADNTRVGPAPDEGLTSPWPGSDAGTAIKPLLDVLPAGTAIDIKGYASYETGGNTSLVYNTDLARRRALGLRAIVEHLYGTSQFTITNNPDMSQWDPTHQGDPVRNLFWKAVATWPPHNPPGTTTQGTVSRAQPQPPTPVPVPDNPTNASPPPPPSWFKQIGAKVRIVRDHFVACELDGKFDIQTASENQLSRGGVANADIPQWQGLGSQNPADGIVEARIVVQIDDATDTVTISGYFGADPADRDGLMMTGSMPGQPLAPRTLGRNYLGMAIAFMPLLSAASSAVAGDGAYEEISVTAAVLALPITLGSLPWITVERVVWYGGEVDVQVRPEGSEVIILLDLETAVSANVEIAGHSLIRIARDAPLSVRYKAVGLLIGNPPGQPKFQFRPMFDSSKGYTIDVSKPGAIQVADPLGQILKILGARIARNNPLLFEIDLGFAIDLGVVSIDRARVRMQMDPPGPPELTAFGASIDIPGALAGRGYLEMNASEIKGQIDLTITPVQVRVAAGVAVAHIAPPDGPATAVIVTLEVDFPVAIPLANSGLGIYGFLGLFAMNYARNEAAIPADNTAPALAWLKATGGDPTNLAYWTPKVNTWAFGVGALLGTEGTDVIFNLKGVILLELPGPRLLLMMKAKLLSEPPGLKSTEEGLLLAVIDLDFGRGTLTIGLFIDYKVDPLLEIKIPVEAFFNFNDTSDWHLYLGQYVNQVQAKVFQVFDASGYLMLSGAGISGIPNLPAVTGFSIATGLHISFTWGDTDIGLYAQIAGGFDAVVGFTPFRMAGNLTIRGSLHLFILDISAYAELKVNVGDDGAGGKIARIEGQICGEVDFLFFSVSGCVDFALGADAVPLPDPPDLIKSLTLVSRSPALVMGTGVDKPIDSGIGDAKEGDADPGDLPVVPIDAIPVLMMAVPPQEDPGLTFLGKAINGTPDGLPPDGYVQRGDVWFKYTVTNIELIGPITAGNAPATWWKSRSGAEALEAQLALLSWVPEPTPKAVGSSTYLDETVEEQWGTVCEPAAPAAPVFFSFLQQILGPSDTGWQLYGSAWPDPSGTVRSMPPNLGMQVTERWRCGDRFVDKMRGIVPAQVEGSPVACPVQVPPIHLPPIHLPPVLGGQPVATHGPVAMDPISAIRGTAVTESVVVGEALTLDQVIHRFSLGQPVARSSLAGMSLSDVLPAAQGQCFSRALASPIFDDGQIIDIGDQTRAKTVEAAWANLGFKPGPLDDAVVFGTGEFTYARFYLWVPLRLLSLNCIVVAVSDEHDTIYSEHIATPADRIPPRALPGSWTDPVGPWNHDVTLLTEMQNTATIAKRGYVGVLVEVKGAQGADRVQIGLLPASRNVRRPITLRPFYAAGIEVLSAAETIRYDYDTTQQQDKQGVLQDALGLDSADNALLQAGQSYQVRITYDAARERRPEGQPPTDQKSVTGKQQSFWFQTDSNPPSRLDPWVMVALPGEAEQHVFASEPIKVVFATNNVGLIYTTYGKKLQARLRPSSFRPVPSTPAVPHPLPLNESTLIPVKAALLSPWEEAVQNLATTGLPCVSVEGDRIRHSMITMPIPLDLDTDYVLDIEMIDAAAEDGTPGDVVWRGSFSSGGFHTLDEFANSFQIARVKHRGVHVDDAGKLQAIGAMFAARDPQGSEFDTALTNAGLDPQPVAAAPRVVVFWDPTTPQPQPAALLVDSSEPMWRERPIPIEITDPGPAAAKHYELTPVSWLQLAQQSGGDDIVDHIVPAPGGQRALVTLKPNARGSHLRLALKRIAQTAPYLDGPGATDGFYSVLDMTLDSAPWEEVD